MPNVHPLLVHFPIALIAMSALCEVLALAMKNRELSRVGWWTQLAGTLGLAAAATSGLLAEKSVSFSAAARDLFTTHQQLAFLCCALFGALLLWRVASRSNIPPGHGLEFVALLLAGAILLFVVAWFGGEMVFQLGVGVRDLPG